MNKLSEPALAPCPTEPAYFSAAEHLVGLVQRALAEGHDTRISLPGKGAVYLFPAQRAYAASLVDLAGFCQMPAACFKTALLDAEQAALLRDASPLRNVSELLWTAAFHASNGRMVESRVGDRLVHMHDIIRFRHWPNLSRLPITGNTMRICALLTRQPSSILLIPRKLGISAEEMFQVYSAAYCSGALEILSADPQAAASPAAPPAAAHHDLLRGLLAKLIRL